MRKLACLSGCIRAYERVCVCVCVHTRHGPTISGPVKPAGHLQSLIEVAMSAASVVVF